MGWLEKLERAPLRADQGALPFDDPRLWTPNYGATDTNTGIVVSAESAKRCSAVFACNSLISETLASLPCVLYRRLSGGGKERARDHRVYRTLRFRPNAWMSPMDFFAGGQMHAGMHGNAMAEIVDDGRAMDLKPMHPNRTTIEQLSTGRLRYQYNDPLQGMRTLLQDRVLHVRDLSDDGFTGQARTVLAREAIAVATAGEGYVANFFRNDATGRLLLTSGTTPDEKTRAQYRKMIDENYAGWQNRSKTMLLWGGMTAQELGKHDDSGFIIDPRKFQVADIARFWRVPLFMIALEEKSTTWGTGIEQQMQGFVDFTVKPWLDRWAQAMTRALLDESEQEEYFIEFLLADLVRGDLKTRMEAYQIGRQIGMWNPNELRAKENEGPREDGMGDEYQQTPTGAAPNTAPPVTPQADPPGDPNAGQQQARSVSAPLLADAANRIAGVEIRAVERRAKKAQQDPAKWTAWVQTYFASHREMVEEVLAPLAATYQIEAWVVEQAAERIERTAVAALTVGVPDGWLTARRAEVALLIDETFSAGAAVAEAHV